MKTEEEGIEYRDKIPLLEQFLIEILNTDTQIYYFEKAKSLLRDRSKLIVDMRILSDLRPVFKDDKIEPPEYCVITHNLRITYIKERERKKAIFALDQEDLSKLQLQIKRALEKDSELHTIAKKSGLEVFEVI